jgi:biopolymer transport protein ExbD
MKFKRTQVEDIHINLTPMIDCLLFILVFLLLSTTFSQFSRMNLTLPDAQGVPPKQFEQKVEVVVDASGHYSINGQSIASKDVADLNTAIKQISNERRDLMFVIAADAKAIHQDVIRVMDVAGQLGFVNINISTKVPSRGYE